MVPRQIKNLEHLQTLDLNDTLLSGLPETVTKLEKLEYIRFSNRNNIWGIMWTVPRGINKMKDLRVLYYICLGNDSKVAQELGELEQLEELILSIDDRKTIAEDVLKELALSLSKMHSLRWLSIGHQSDDDNGGKILNFLNDLATPPRLLRTLWIHGDVDGLPNWIGSLAHLVTFTISDTTLIDDQLFGMLCKLPNLKTLCVDWKCHNKRDELVARTSHKFLVLRDLLLGDHLPKVLWFEEGSMTTVEMLELKFNYRSRHVLERSIVGIEQLTNLRKVKLHGKKENPALIHFLEQLKAESDRPSRSNNPFEVVVEYE